MAELLIPKPLSIALERKKAYDPSADGYVELDDSAAYGDDKHYKATCKLSGTVFDLTGWTFKFAIGAKSGSVVTIIADAGAGDFDTTGAASGVISWPVNMLEAPYQALLASITQLNDFVTALANLWGMPPGGTKWQLVAAWTIKLGYSVGVTDSPPDHVTDYAALSTLNARISAGISVTADADGRAVITVNGIERGRL